MKGFRAGIFLLIWGLSQGLIWPPQPSRRLPPFAQRLYGTWYTYPLGNPATDSIRHEFRHSSETGKDEISVSHICEGEDLGGHCKGNGADRRLRKYHQDITKRFPLGKRGERVRVPGEH